MLKRLPGLIWTGAVVAFLVRKFAPELPHTIARRVSTTAAELPGAISVEEPTLPAEDGPVVADAELPLQVP